MLGGLGYRGAGALPGITDACGRKVLLDSIRAITRARFVTARATARSGSPSRRPKASPGPVCRVILLPQGTQQAPAPRGSSVGNRPGGGSGELHGCHWACKTPPGRGTSMRRRRGSSKELADVLPVEEKLNAVVVDEEQDFALLWREALLTCLKKPDDG